MQMKRWRRERETVRLRIKHDGGPRLGQDQRRNVSIEGRERSGVEQKEDRREDRKKELGQKAAGWRRTRCTYNIDKQGLVYNRVYSLASVHDRHKLQIHLYSTVQYSAVQCSAVQCSWYNKSCVVDRACHDACMGIVCMITTAVSVHSLLHEQSNLHEDLDRNPKDRETDKTVSHTILAPTFSFAFFQFSIYPRYLTYMYYLC